MSRAVLLVVVVVVVVVVVALTPPPPPHKMLGSLDGTAINAVSFSSSSSTGLPLQA